MHPLGRAARFDGAEHVTGPYGTTFGNWLPDCGATVVDLAVPFDTAVAADQVGRALPNPAGTGRTGARAGPGSGQGPCGRGHCLAPEQGPRPRAGQAWGAAQAPAGSQASAAAAGPVTSRPAHACSSARVNTSAGCPPEIP